MSAQPAFTPMTTISCWAREGCAVVFSLPSSLYEAARKHGACFYCPRGHKLSVGESEVEELKRKLEEERGRSERERKRTEWAKQEAKTARRAQAIAQGKLKAQSERVKNGVCPCCKRSFTNLRRHMASKHPDFASEEPSR